MKRRDQGVSLEFARGPYQREMWYIRRCTCILVFWLVWLGVRSTRFPILREESLLGVGVFLPLPHIRLRG
jgi:hypothetical protein